MRRSSVHFLILAFLLFALFFLVLGRSRQLPQVVSKESSSPDPTSSAPTQETNLPSFPVSSPTPAPTPLPTPTPRILKEILLRDDELPEELLSEASEKGRVELVQYETCDRVSGSTDPIRKNLAVYLPYGYDETQHYDVLMLLHCAWADHRFWLVENRDYATAGRSIAVSVPNLLDRMIEEGYCRPLIVISPCIYLYDGHPSAAGNQYDYLQFEREVGTDLLPFVARNYATWAEDSDRDSIAAAREHFAVLGASFGAYATYISLIGNNYDLFAWYGFCGGGTIDPGHLRERWSLNGTTDLPLRMLYIAEGEYDDRAGPELSYQALLRSGAPFLEDNVKFTLVRGYGHEDHSYLVGLFNMLQLFSR